MILKQRERHSASLSEDGRYRLLIEAVTDYAIYMLDVDGTVTSWNPGARRFKGYEASEIIGQNYSRFYSTDEQSRGLPSRNLEIARREGRFESEGWRIRKDGSRFWAHVVIDAIREPTGTLVGFAKITRDLTERKQAEEALKAAQTALAEAREALFQSQKIEAIGHLTGGVAHDFNNVLMAVLSSLELMRRRLPDDTKIMALLDNAVQGAQRGVSLTKRMLAFARRQELNLEPVDVPNLVRGMTEMLERSLGPRIMIETRFPLSLSAAQADANQLELALLNLAVNARDAMPDGGPLIISAREEFVTVDHATKLLPGPYVCLAVTDTGEGMDDAILRRAMEPFFTTKGPGKGTGLGLSMVHGVTEQSGGRLILKSKPGKGTTVELWLPAAKRIAQAAQAPVLPQALENATRALNVLAVDDDALVLMNTVAMLEELGHSVRSAISGHQALEILRRDESIDLLITDHAMPHMTGYQLAEAVHVEWPAVSIILASGYAELPAGGTAALHKLAKPFRMDELARALAEATDPAQRVTRTPGNLRVVSGA